MPVSGESGWRFITMLIIVIGGIYALWQGRYGFEHRANDVTPTVGSRELPSDAANWFPAPKPSSARPAQPPATFPLQTAPSQIEQLTAETTKALPISSEVKQRSQAVQRGSRFNKWSYEGQRLGDDAQYWQCAQDQRTGLLWEVKTFDGGVRDVDNTFSWFQPENGHPGAANRGRCFRLDCDTLRYIEAVNAEKLCGRENWRLPTFPELEGLIDRDYYNPTINQAVFPHAQGKVYWTATELDNNPAMVMQVDFFNGFSTAVLKQHAYWLRLVSSPVRESVNNPLIPAGSAPAQIAPQLPAG